MGPAIVTAAEFNAQWYETVNTRLMVTQVGNG